MARPFVRLLAASLLLASSARRGAEALSTPKGASAGADPKATAGGRRAFLSSAGAAAAAAAAAVSISALSPPEPASAAPPMAVIAEELGYFPVTDREGRTLYVPARARRRSTEQAVDLAEHLRTTGAKMYGAYWCPHCSNQKEMFGREAWGLVNYVECSPKGYASEAVTCAAKGVDGYPTWRFGNGKVGSGEMTLEAIAKMSGYKGKIDGSLEAPLPSASGSCR
uniref:Thioredoxin domain-containing protein n=1 Tax=Trieres chinensis TaxID=1514140 RepID=A0A7S2EV16_TRICV